MRKYKICVYAICKNEMKFAERWVENVSEADYIVVLDTGSTDGTYEYLKNDPRVTRVEQEVITPWRFDVARNKSLELVPDDADILVCTDFDEFFSVGWADEVCKAWQPDTTRAHYPYIQARDENGEPFSKFKRDKIHSNHTHHWHFPVHECLFMDADIRQDMVEEEKKAIHIDTIELDHQQDHSKSRSSYTDLLKIRTSESEKHYDPYGHFYYGIDLFCHNYIEEAKEQFEKAVERYEERPNDLDIFNMRAPSYFYLGVIAASKGLYAEAASNFTWAIYNNINYRDAYLGLAEIHLTVGFNDMALGVLTECDKKASNENIWTTDISYAREKKSDLYALVYYNLGALDLAKHYAEQALKLNPDEPRIQMYYNKILEDLKNN